MNGMSASAAELQKYLSYWDKYKYIWENDKVSFIPLIERPAPPAVC